MKHLKPANRQTGKLANISLLLCLLIACHCGKSTLGKYGETFEAIMKSDTSIFRGVNMRMTGDDIKTMEINGLMEEDSNDGIHYLFYELKADSNTSYTVAYSCPNNKLNNIETDVYLLNEPQAADLFNSFKTYFDNKYGTSQKSGDFLLWSALTSSGKIRVELADESPTYKRGKLTLIIRTPNDDEQ
jgi:hypothetical protein